MPDSCEPIRPECVVCACGENKESAEAERPAAACEKKSAEADGEPAAACENDRGPSHEWKCVVCACGENEESVEAEGPAAACENEGAEAEERPAAACENGGEDAEGQEEVSEEARQPVTKKGPKTPTKEEVDAHNLIHLPYRDWCTVCVRARKRNEHHHRQDDSDHSVPTVGMDYCFLKDAEGNEVKVLVTKDYGSRVHFSDAVEFKGRGTEGTVERVARHYEQLGHKKMILRCDQEPAIVDLARAICEIRADPTLLEHSPVGESQSNGKIERGVQTVEEQVRAHLFGLEKRIDRKISATHDIMTWLVMHAGTTISRSLVGQDGQTGFERLMGKPARDSVVEFGEKVEYRLGHKDRGQLEERWQEGIWLGKVWGTGECYIATQNGVVKARAIQRKPAADRWDPAAIGAVCGTPWKMKPDIAPSEVRVLPPRPQEEIQADAAGPNPAEADEAPPKGLRIVKADFEKFGYTDACPRCRTMRAGRIAKPGVNHSAACKTRMERELTRVEDPRVQQALVRDMEYRLRNPSAAAVEAEVPPHVEAETGNISGPQGDIETEDENEKGQDQMDVERELFLLNVDPEVVATTVSEMYSPPRVTKEANKRMHFNIKGLNAFDIRADKEGVSWDFSKREDREMARRIVEKTSPMWIIGSPPCTSFCQWNEYLNYKRMDPKEVLRRKTEELVHLQFCCELYAYQLAHGRHFLHEHPATATSWKEPAILQILRHERVQWVIADMCQHGMCSQDGRPVKKPTGFMSSSTAMLSKLGVRCRGRGGVCDRAKRPPYTHAHLVGGRACQHAAIYPAQLCLSILKGIRAETERTLQGPAIHGLAGLHEQEEEDSEWYDYFDEITGAQLPTCLVKAARQEELQWIDQKKIWDIRPIAECFAVTGQAPIDGKWVDVNKKDEVDPEIRSRYVARDMKRGSKSDEFFAAAPPLEAIKMLLSKAATGNPRGRRQKKLAFIDVRKAHFNGKPSHPTYVALPPEYNCPGMCARLNWCLYGTREAGRQWERCYTEVLVKAGFVRGRNSPVCFYHKARDISVVVHGDDFTALGEDAALDWFEELLASVFEIKIRGRLGGDDKDDKEITILNRVVRWTKEGFRYEADPRHLEILVKTMGLCSASGVSTPGAKVKLEERLKEVSLGPVEATSFRACAARANYLAQDRADFSFACKEVCREMSEPKSGSWERLKRTVRYGLHMPRLVHHYRWQTAGEIETYVDSDWAGCVLTRKSTSGGAIMLGDHLVKHWSSTQSVLALSSTEAELYALVKGAGQALGAQSLLRDLGDDRQVNVHTDSSGATGVVRRTGVGKLRHIDVADLWVQDKAATGAFKLKKVLGTENPADGLTKYVDGPLLTQHMQRLHLWPETGRPKAAPQS